MKEYIAVIEQAIRKLGISPEEAKNPRKNEWLLQVGKFPVWVTLQLLDAEKQYFGLYVRSVVLENISKSPDEKKLLRFLLEQNSELMDVAWAIQNDVLILRSFRPMQKMNAENIYEVLRLMEAVLVNIGTKIEFFAT